MKNKSPLFKKFKIWFNRLINKPQWVGEWTFTVYNTDGSIKDSWKQYNALADEGEKDILDIVFRDASEPSSFYVRLFNDTPVETDTLADLTGEVTGGGYTAQPLARNNTDFPTLALNSGDYQLTSKSVTFTATGSNFSTATYAVLATTTNNTGKLYAYVALSTTFNLLDGQGLSIVFNIKLQ